MANLGNDQMEWMQNSGAGLLGSPIPVVSIPPNTRSLVLADFDPDGDLDPMATNSMEARLYENLGSGLLGTAQTKPHGQGGLSSRISHVVDMNGDGDLDLLKRSYLGMILQQNLLRFGDAYCEPVEANSTGLPGRIRSWGTSTVSSNNFSLIAEQLPAISFGFSLVASEAGHTAMPGGSQGDLCLGGHIARMNRNASEIFDTASNGVAHVSFDLANLPILLGATTLMAGDTRYFQAWYRDQNPGPASNFTGGLRVRFE